MSSKAGIIAGAWIEPAAKGIYLLALAFLAVAVISAVLDWKER